MHVRFSTALGMPVIPDGERMPVGTISGILIHPENGGIEGFFVQHDAMLLHKETVFLPTNGIRHWGLAVRITDEDALCPVDDVLRCQSILESGKVILGQPMITEDGRSLGRCRDVQFSTSMFQVDWLFPRKWFRSQPSIAFKDVKEVRSDAVVVRSGAIPVPAVPVEMKSVPA